MTSSEKKQHTGCAACHRTTQKCEFKYTCWGPHYNEDNLERIDREDYDSSELSTEAEDMKEIGKNEKGGKAFTFYLGESCGKFASVKSRLLHWEFRVVSDIVDLPAFAELHKKNGKDLPIREGDVESVVRAYYPKLSSRCSRLEEDATKLSVHASGYSRLKERWDD